MTRKHKVKAVHREQRAKVRRRKFSEAMGMNKRSRVGIMDQSGNIVASSIGAMSSRMASQKKG